MGNYKSFLLNKDPNFRAYLLGYIATDGCLYYGKQIKPYISLACSIEDRQFLTGLIYNLSSDKNSLPEVWCYEKTNRRCGTRISNEELIELCVNIGITPRKSLTLDVKLDDKSDEFKWYFLRGVIDGDGCVMFKGKGGTQTVRVFTASESFKNNLVKFYKPKNVYTAPSDANNRRGAFFSNNDLYTVTFSGSYLNNLLQNIPLEDFCLLRKTDKLKQLIKYRQNMYRKSESLIYTGKYKELVCY